MVQNNYPQYPLYIPSKGRSEYMLTSIALTKMGVNHYIIVEPNEVKKYNIAVKRYGLKTEVLELDMSYKEKYELCDNLGLSKSTGPGPARNFAWDHSISNGFDYHWVMDDNIVSFCRLYNNLRTKVLSSGYWRAMEDFILRYSNVVMGGPAYTFFVMPKNKCKPFIINTRIYSCNFIKNNIPFRWRGRYNEDTILSLDILTAGLCTIQFYLFQQEKLVTQVLKGGNTDEFYHKEGKLSKDSAYAIGGTDAKTIMLKKVYPEIVEVVHKFGRTHHSITYRKYFKQKLIRKKDIILPQDPEYGMNLIYKYDKTKE